MNKFGKVAGKSSMIADNLGFHQRSINRAIMDLKSIGFIERYENKDTGEVGLKVNPQFMHRGSTPALMSKLHREVGRGWVGTPTAVIDISPVTNLNDGNCFVEKCNRS